MICLAISNVYILLASMYVVIALLMFALFHQPALQYLLNGLEVVSVGINISILSIDGIERY